MAHMGTVYCRDTRVPNIVEDCGLLGGKNLKEERRIPPSKDHRPHALHNRYSQRTTAAY